MTLPELLALRARVDEHKAAGRKPVLAEILAELKPEMLPMALAAEADGKTHIEFRAGVPVVVPGPARFTR
jgi:hypothetical protein